MEKLKVFYDGKCHLCYREVSHYAKKDHGQLLELIDISSDQFKACDFNLSTEEVNLHMHAMDQTGRIFKGVDAFIEIWKRVPPYHHLIPLFENSLLRPLWNKSYDIFAKNIRPKLPKRNCEEGTCGVSHPSV